MLGFLGALIVVVVVALAVAAHALVRDHERRALLERAGGTMRGELVALKRVRHGFREDIARWLVDHAPRSWRERDSDVDQLVRAGFDSPAASTVYTVIRIAAAIALPLVALATVPRHDEVTYYMLVAMALLFALLLPPAAVARMVRQRQERMRHALPDSLDLLVVCVEAGISLDAAILRVARDMALLHPELADELMLVARRVNAGETRERALRGLWARTGVDELRGLAANMIQSEKWGTSIATVLRVYAESSRKKRRQMAERKAATAPLKMLFPMALFIFPSLFIVLLGPALIKMADMFRDIAR